MNIALAVGFALIAVALIIPLWDDVVNPITLEP